VLRAITQEQGAEPELRRLCVLDIASSYSTA
jgi:hypothetical protein